MLITPSNINLFFTGVETRYNAAFTTAPVWYQQIADEIPCATESMAFGWMGMLDTFRMWKGSRVVRQPAPQTYVVTPDPFELTQAVDQFKLKDDTYGIYNNIATNFGFQAAKWPDYQLRDLILNLKDQTGAARQNGTDLISHWNTAHPIDFWDASKGTFCNDFRGTFTVGGTVVGGAFTVNGFNTLWQEFSARKSESGEPLGIEPNLSMGPSQLKAAMMTVLQAKFIGMPQINGLGSGSGANGTMVGATENVLTGWTDLLTNPDFNSAATTWFMLCTNRAQKPFSFVMRERPDYVARTASDDPVVFDTHTYQFGSMARGAPAWSLPWLSAISSP